MNNKSYEALVIQLWFYLWLSAKICGSQPRFVALSQDLWVSAKATYELTDRRSCAIISFVSAIAETLFCSCELSDP